MLRLTISSVRRALLFVIVGIVAVSIVGQVSKRYLGHKNLMGIVPLFDLDTEANVAAWYQSITLAICGALIAYIAARSWAARKPFSRHWALLAAIFFFLSVDETSSLHERMADMLNAARGAHFTGILYYAWVLPYAVLVVLCGVAYAQFLRKLPPNTRNQFLVSGAVYVAGALGMEMVGGRHASLYGTETLTYLIMTTFEETLEMAGVALFMIALLRHIQAAFGELRVSVQLDDDRSGLEERVPETLRSLRDVRAQSVGAAAAAIQVPVRRSAER